MGSASADPGAQLLERRRHRQVAVVLDAVADHAILAAADISRNRLAAARFGLLAIEVVDREQEEALARLDPSMAERLEQRVMGRDLPAAGFVLARDVPDLHD